MSEPLLQLLILAIQIEQSKDPWSVKSRKAAVSVLRMGVSDAEKELATLRRELDAACQYLLDEFTCPNAHEEWEREPNCANTCNFQPTICWRQYLMETDTTKKDVIEQLFVMDAKE